MVPCSDCTRYVKTEVSGGVRYTVCRDKSCGCSRVIPEASLEKSGCSSHHELLKLQPERVERRPSNRIDFRRQKKYQYAK